MKGALTGDYVGSIYEFNNTKDPNFKFIEEGKEITDDSVCTIATAYAILEGIDYGSAYVEICHKMMHPMGAYGTGFMRWLVNPKREPYNSCGNGSAMRVSPVGWAFDKEDVMLAEAEKSAICTHNHKEGIKGAQATAHAIWYFRKYGNDLEGFKKLMSQYYPEWESFEKPFDEFNAICQNTLPLCIQEVASGTSFEDTIRKTILRGGDTDTNACIAGAMAEARWGVPTDLWEAALDTAPLDFRLIVNKFVEKYVL